MSIDDKIDDAVDWILYYPKYMSKILLNYCCRRSK